MTSTYPAWVFDNSPIPDPGGHGERAVRFLRRLKHPASTAPGNLFQLTPWQERIVRRIYGPRYPDGRRIVKEVFLMIPRGNRKTSLAAALALLHLLGPERVPAGQIIFAASDREQAGIGFREAVEIVRQDRRLGQVTRIYDAHNSAKMIQSTIDGSTLKAIPADGRGQHGTTPTFVLADETHSWRKNRELWEALRTGMAKRPGGLIVMATTAGRGREGLAAERYDYARKIALGEIVNEEYLPILFEPQEGDDWQDEAMWHRVNPGLAYGFPDIDGLRTLAREAADSPSEMYAFRQFHLCEWMGNSHDPLFNFETYDARQFDDDEADISEFPCWVGVDLSRSGDLTAVVAAFLWPDGQVTLRPKFFVPGEDLKARSDRDGVPYQAWADQGFIHLCPGPIIDEEAVEAEIREICGTYDVQEIAFDPHLAARIMQRLYDDGLPVVELRQSPLNMGLAGADLEKIVNGKLVRHDGHPVLRNHLSSVVAVRTDSGLTRMVKGRKTDRIDGAVAAAMAVSRACAGESNLSGYNDPAASLFVF
ncbi:terminase large subunit [Pseudotabrizicola alkalilacus]|uniref:Terminase large subunit n=1 Tax=Pseudotabrizicola alkalilacus TaxID=2305252 RepID=A0A411Z3Q3_9RHOB|nr:terminase TerL endonuclease subunit [Pseudotabrizicola alkalilacus]RGP37693.1 terminase large subunit [Pseudotabrizicola alkalilacus]